MRAVSLLALAIAGGLAFTASVSMSDPGAGDARTKSAASPLDDGRRLCRSYSGIPEAAPEAPCEAGMVWIAGGSFRMGSNKFYPEERSPRNVRVSGFWISRHEVTNAQFAAFVAATGYRTVSERGLDPKIYPDIPPQLRAPGSMVFFEPKNSRVRLNIPEWWRYVPGANWRHPFGPDSSISGRENHPAVHIAFADTQAYARWRGHTLPTEAEWEFAARGGIDGADYAWGDEPTPNGHWMANTWQGFFTGPVRVIKGGSWLCASNFCGRYRPSARQPQEIDLGASHIGFRTILRGRPPAADR